MLLLKQGVNSNIVVTITEKVSLINPYYLFVFTNITTNDKVKFILSDADDLSPFPERFNEFIVNVSLFSLPGQYLYKIYEQSSSTNLNETGNELENGKMNLLPSVGVSRTEYSTNTTYKTYQG